MPEDPLVENPGFAETAPPSHGEPRRGFLKQHGAKAAAVGVAVAVLVGVALFNEVRGTAGAQQPRVVTVTPSAPTGAKVDLTRPFAGTPAAEWLDGESGVTAPKAVAVGPFSAQQVAEAYTKVRQAVVVSRLDRAVLENHQVERYLSLLAKDSQKNMRPVFGNNPPEAHAYATRLASGSKLLPVAPKVNGRMWAEQGTRTGELVVHTNYVFAYAFQTEISQGLADVMDIVAVDRWDVDYSVLSGRYAPSSLGIWPVRSQGFTYSMGCEALRRGYLAPAFTEQRANAALNSPNRDRTAYFDPHSNLPASSTCD
jgi:hypothetical protein